MVPWAFAQMTKLGPNVTNHHTVFPLALVSGIGVYYKHKCGIIPWLQESWPFNLNPERGDWMGIDNLTNMIQEVPTGCNDTSDTERSQKNTVKGIQSSITIAQSDAMLILTWPKLKPTRNLHPSTPPFASVFA